MSYRLSLLILSLLFPVYPIAARAEPPLLKEVVNETLESDPLSRFDVTGKVSWRQKQLTLEPGASIARRTNGAGSFVGVKVKLNFPVAARPEDQWVTQLAFKLGRTKHCAIEWKRERDKDKQHTKLSLVYGIVQRTGKAKREVLRSRIFKNRFEPGEWSAIYRYGLVVVTSPSGQVLMSYVDEETPVSSIRIRSTGAATRLHGIRIAANTAPPQLSAANRQLLSRFKFSQRRWSDRKLRNAEDAYRRILRLQHPVTYARRVRDLALINCANGQFSNAAELLTTQVMPINEKHLGKDHPETASTFDDLAIVYRLSGKAKAAADLVRRAQSIQQKLGATDREITKRALSNDANRLQFLGVQLLAKQKLTAATVVFADVLKIFERLFPRSRFPDGHPIVATSMVNLTSLYSKQGKFGKAHALLERALQMQRKLYPTSRFPDGHLAIAKSLHNLATLRGRQGDYDGAASAGRRALEMRQRLYPPARYPKGHEDLASSLLNLAQIHKSRGALSAAEPLFKRAMEMYEAHNDPSFYTRGNETLAFAKRALAELHMERGEYAKAEALFESSLRSYRRMYSVERFPAGTPSLAASMGALAHFHMTMGDLEKAKSIMASGLKMYERLFRKSRYPQGHPALAIAMGNLAAVHHRLGEHQAALDLCTRALKMKEALYPKSRYPNGHPSLVSSINSLGMFHLHRREHEQAERFLSRGLRMAKLLYPASKFPNSHPQIALFTNNLSLLQHRRGNHVEAKQLLLDVLKMEQARYPIARFPHGHPDLALLISNLASTHFALGESAAAQRLARQALRMYVAYAGDVASIGSSTRALNFAGRFPSGQNLFLSTTLKSPPATTYSKIWQSKGVLSRGYENRHLSIVAAANAKTRVAWQAILDLRRRRERLLLSPVSKQAAKSGRKNRIDRINQLNEQISSKRRELLERLPLIGHRERLATAPPTQLQQLLPANTVFVDLLRYRRSIRQARTVVTRPHYAGFVISHEKVERVELGEASEIETAVIQLLRAIKAGDGSEQRSSSKVARLVWRPIEQRFPRGTKRVYLSPDMELARVPWAMLPGKVPKSVVLQDYEIATVPHGPFLLDRRSKSQLAGNRSNSTLLVGAVAYNDKPMSESVRVALRSPADRGRKVTWKTLEGTAKELQGLTELAGQSRRVTKLTGTKVSVQRLLRELPRARVAHLATHGFFGRAKFRARFQLDDNLFVNSFGGSDRNAMVLSGLVCAGANLPTTKNRGILTADAIIGLDLRQLNLAVLSACESSLGAIAQGEGVYGLQRAFHIAGARNVVGSLWSVDDHATAALMVLFYRGLWKQKLPPIKALRLAQLAIYNNPAAIPAWSQGRGPDFKATVQIAQRRTPGSRRAPARLWAAFILSGPGD